MEGGDAEIETSNVQVVEGNLACVGSVSMTSLGLGAAGGGDGDRGRYRGRRTNR